MPSLRCSRPFVAVAAAAVSAFAAVLLASPSAGAFCRTVTATPPAGYDPATLGCFDSQGGPGVYDVYWANLCVGYSVNNAGSAVRGISYDQAKTVADAAFAEWAAVTCPSGGHPSVTAQDQGGVDCAKVEYNMSEPNQHVIMFDDANWPYSDSSNTLGLTTVTYDTTDGEIYDADMELNSAQYQLVAAPPVPTGAYDLMTVITHEAGHFLGLAHSADGTAVMYAHYHSDASVPTQDDVDGICTIYPPGGTRTTNAGSLAGCSCDPTPRHGFSTQCGSSLAPAVNPDQNAGICDPGSGGMPLDRTGNKCSVTQAPSSTTRTYGPFGLVALALAAPWMRRWRQRARRGRAQGTLVAFLALVSAGTAGTIGLVSREASASVSVAAVFEDMLRQSTAVAAVTPVERQVVWEDGRIVTYTRVRVDSSIAGELPQDVWVRTLGGAIGKIGQIVEGEPSFVVGQPSLVFLRARSSGRGFEVTARAQGQFAIVTGADKVTRLMSARDVGAILPAAAGASRVARQVLEGRELQDASREIAATWARVRSK
jgi:MYXO-CTERM domain-containing protein